MLTPTYSTSSLSGSGTTGSQHDRELTEAYAQAGDSTRYLSGPDITDGQQDEIWVSDIDPDESLRQVARILELQASSIQSPDLDPEALSTLSTAGVNMYIFVLDSAITRLCRSVFKNVQWGNLDESIQKRFTAWSPAAQELFGLLDGSEYFFRAWMWRILVENVFNRKSRWLAWNSPYTKKMDDLQNILLEKEPELSNQIPTMAMFTRVSPKSDIPNERPTCLQPESIRKILVQEIDQYLPELLTSPQQAKMDTVTRAASEAGWAYSVSKVEFSFHFCHPLTKDASGFGFQHRIDGYGQNNLVMEDLGCFQSPLDYWYKTEGERFGNVRGKPVDLVIRPLLVGRGRRFQDCDNLDIYNPMVVWVSERFKGQQPATEASSGQGKD